MAVPAAAAMARARSALARKLRDALEERGYLEVETPVAIPFAGQEPHLRPFETRFTPDPPVAPGGLAGARRLHLHTSPEYAMKRLLAREGFSRCYQLARVFRDGEVSRTHNPEFTLLEFYAAPGSADSIMADLEQILSACVPALPGPFERITCQEAFRRYAAVDALSLEHDAFTQVLLDEVEPKLGVDRPTFLTEYPASHAALARLKPSDPRVAERFELYAFGLELANGFSELCDTREQRRRLLEEQEQRRRLGREVFPLDERFLAALDRIGEAGGVAVGFDRLLMILTGARTIDEVLLFPAAEEYPAAREAP
jgi:lysyl-tRNA synthetase class 2